MNTVEIAARAAYSKKRTAKVRRWFPAASINGEIAVVIPLCDEYPSFFATLQSLEKSLRESQLGTSVDMRDVCTVYCVVNNRADSADSVKTNNQMLLTALRDYCGTDAAKQSGALRLCVIDAASSGRELTAVCGAKNGGAGLARKIGMDYALESGARTLACMDGDTLVSENYFSALYDFAKDSETRAACTKFCHQAGETPQIEHAIRHYEHFLFEHSRRLQNAGTPYFQIALGPTIVCKAEAYMASGGMNMRDAGEDFYFLQALTKVCAGQGRLPHTLDCIVHPSARLSERVPFGTGQTLAALLAGTRELGNPDSTYAALAAFLTIAERAVEQRADAAFFEKQLPDCVIDFLRIERFSRVWERLSANNPTVSGLRRAFHYWFDGLKIIRLIHRLNDGTNL